MHARRVSNKPRQLVFSNQGGVSLYLYGVPGLGRGHFDDVGELVPDSGTEVDGLAFREMFKCADISMPDRTDVIEFSRYVKVSQGDRVGPALEVINDFGNKEAFFLSDTCVIERSCNRDWKVVEARQGHVLHRELAHGIVIDGRGARVFRHR